MSSHSWFISSLKASTLVSLIFISGCSSTEKKKSIIPAPSKGEVALLDSAMDTYTRELFTKSSESWKELRDGYPTSPFASFAELKVADSLFYAADYPAAILAYEEFIRLHPGHEAVAYSRFQIAESQFAQYKDPQRDPSPLQTAIKAYALVSAEFPRSDFSYFANKRISECQELLAEYELNVANFYKRRELWAAYADRIGSLIEKYPNTRAAAKGKEDLAQTPEAINTTATASVEQDADNSLFVAP